MNKKNRKSLHRMLGALTGVVAFSMIGTLHVVAQSDSLLDLNVGASVYLECDADDIASLVTEKTAETEVAEVAEEVEEPVSNLIMSNVEDSVNVREDANEEATVVGKLYKNCSGEILEQRDGWTKIKSGNLEGWAKDEFLFFGEEATAMMAQVGTLKATIHTDALRVRKEAAEDAGVYGLVKNGDVLVALEELEGWIKVQYDEETVGYVSSEFVTVAFTVDTGKTSQEIADEERAKELKKLTKNRGAIPSSVSDVTLLAALIQCEAGGQPYEGQVAVGAVVMNRVRSGYGGSIIAVISSPGQFPPATNGKVAAVVASGPKSSCIQAAQDAVNGATTVGGATHFSRAGSRDGIVIGSHVFW